MTELDVIMKLRLHIVEHFDSKKNFAKHLGVSNAYISAITSKSLEKRKPIPDYILKIIGIKKTVVYTNENTPNA